MKKYFIIILTLLVGLWNETVQAQCTDNGNYWEESWVSCQTSMNPNPIRGNTHWILYEFNENQYIDSSYVWNANRTGESGWGAKDVVIDYSEDGTTWMQLGNYTFPQAPETSNYTGFQGPEFGNIYIKKILVTILSTYDNTGCASIAEMQFKVDPTACYGVLDICGICDGPGEITWYIDVDGDGFGDASSSVTECIQPAGYVSDNSDLCDDGALGWSDIGPLFVNSGCTNCHGGASGLDLSTYASFAMGGNRCGPGILTGTTLVDIITIDDYDGCGSTLFAPAMNGRTNIPLDAAELERIQTWINGGAPENCADFDLGLTSVGLKVFLEGAYEVSQGLMRTTLNDENLLPTQQPYNVSPYNYMGTETLTTFPAKMVDWVLVELRTGKDAASKVESKAGILMDNGEIKDTDGVSDLVFDLPGNLNYYFVIRHRNHLDVMTAVSMKNLPTLTYDFTTYATQAYGVQQLKVLQDGVAVMHAADITQDMVIQITDYDAWKTDPALLDVYELNDVNLDGVVQVTDYDLWYFNRTKIAPMELSY